MSPDAVPGADFGKNGAMASSLRLLPDPHRIPAARGRASRSAAATATDASAKGSAKWVLGGIIGGSAAAGLLAAGSSALALYFARRVITPAKVKDEDQEILAVIRAGHGLQVILAATPESTVEGVYGLFFDGGRGHARIGRIVSYSPAERTVQREVEAVYSGDLGTARRGYWSGAAFPDPASIGLPPEDVDIDVDGGTAPAWLVRAPHESRDLGDHGPWPGGEPAGMPPGRPCRPGTGPDQLADFLPQ